jgi:hypothetical protein
MLEGRSEESHCCNALHLVRQSEQCVYRENSVGAPSNSEMAHPLATGLLECVKDSGGQGVTEKPACRKAEYVN